MRVLEKYLVEQCAPTLASLKLGSMFALTLPEGTDLDSDIAEQNALLKEKGLFLTVLRVRGDRATVYLCRLSQLERELNRGEVREFLSKCGYTRFDVTGALRTLISRFAATDSIPHEIGVFLGYPLGDVLGFIANRGRNSVRTGYWQVYCDETEAAAKFARYRKCHEVYARLWMNGKSVSQLAVSA